MLRLPRQFPSHWGLIFGLVTMVLFFFFGGTWLGHLKNPLVAGLLFIWLIPAILGAAFSVVHHADAVAHRLGEPFGTLVLTLSVTGMEVTMVTVMMLTGPSNPTLARDTMFAVVMIVLGGLVGVALLVGGFRHKLQEFNLEGANSFLSLIIPLSLLGLVMPNFTRTTDDPTFSPLQAIVVAGVCFSAYAIFLAIQTIRHREFFAQEILGDAGAHNGAGSTRSLTSHVTLLIVSLVPVVMLSEELAHVLDFGAHELGVPEGIAGLVVAGLILAPEGMGGILAAARNQLQRSVNLLLGSALATIALTIPSVLMVGVITGRTVVLGLPAADIILLSVVLALCLMTFSRGRTNLLQGAIHLLIFIVWIALLFQN